MMAVAFTEIVQKQRNDTPREGGGASDCPEGARKWLGIWELRPKSWRIVGFRPFSGRPALGSGPGENEAGGASTGF
jgi:hypothetical protein